MTSEIAVHFVLDFKMTNVTRKALTCKPIQTKIGENTCHFGRLLEHFWKCDAIFHNTYIGFCLHSTDFFPETKMRSHFLCVGGVGVQMGVKMGSGGW